MAVVLRSHRLVPAESVDTILPSSASTSHVTHQADHEGKTCDTSISINTRAASPPTGSPPRRQLLLSETQRVASSRALEARPKDEDTAPNATPLDPRKCVRSSSPCSPATTLSGGLQQATHRVLREHLSAQAHWPRDDATVTDSSAAGASKACADHKCSTDPILDAVTPANGHSRRAVPSD